MLTSLKLDDYELLNARAAVMAEIRHPHIMRQIETFIGTALVAGDEEAERRVRRPLHRRRVDTRQAAR